MFALPIDLSINCHFVTILCDMNHMMYGSRQAQTISVADGFRASACTLRSSESEFTEPRDFKMNSLCMFNMIHAYLKYSEINDHN